MRLTTLRLQNFRNHLDTSFEFGDGTNALLGDNGQGKTNVIEAISYLCLTKSFYAGSDALVVHFGKNMFEVDGSFVQDSGNEQQVRVAYTGAEPEKVYMINKRRIEPFSTVIGKFPVVICSPEYTPVTMGGPAERRKFIDFIISQSSATYFQRLLEYRQVLRHRNKMLLDAKITRRPLDGSLASWDEQLLTLGSYLMFRRSVFVAEFQSCMRSAYAHLVGEEEVPTIVYQSQLEIGGEPNEENIFDGLREELSRRHREEARVGTSLVGPHRDELVFKINDIELRKYASQGQHKTFLVALKIGEFHYLKERCRETPILLLDDVFSELDDRRADRLLDFVGELSQTFITSTNPKLFRGRADTAERHRCYFINGGAVCATEGVMAS